MMASDYQMMLDAYESAGRDADVFRDSQVAHLVIHQNRVVGAHLVPGLLVEPEELEDGVRAAIVVEKDAVIPGQVHMCFGVLPQRGLQRILLNIEVRSGGSVDILAHCIFPNAVDVTHLMDADIAVGDDASYRYLEQHVHGDEGGVHVVPKARVKLGANARFDTEFELIQGRVGRIEIDYETWCGEGSSMRMLARISGRGDDRIDIREVGHLEGARARGALISRVAVRDRAEADIYNELSAWAAGARGHVDCKEIVQGQAVARATPVVEVRHPLAHITHEAAIGSVDRKQLETLLARGMDEEEAVELIIRGLLSKKSIR